MATIVKHEKGHSPRHQYPTRWSLRRHASRSLSMAPKLDVRDKNQVLVACKRKKEENNSLSLPREIIFNILLLIPAPVLYEVVRYVCKHWYDVVSDPLFVKAHQQMSSAGFLIQDVYKFQACYVEAGTTTGLKLTQLDIPFPAKIMGSHNGLLLLHDLRNHLIFHVMNLVTKEKITLPPLVELGKNYTGTCFALTSAGHYKVFHATGSTRSDKIYMRVFTVGIDKAWRFIDLQGIPMKTSKNYTMLYRPLYVAGFSYWYHTGLCSGFALDADSETIYQFPKPNYEWPCYIRTVFLTIGTCLGFIELGTWKLWKLTDFKSGKWSELVGVGLNLKEARDRIDKVFYPSRGMVFDPIKLIKEEFWFLHGGQEQVNVVRYNLTTGRFVFYPLPTKHPSSILHSHVHTLLSPMKFSC